MSDIYHKSQTYPPESPSIYQENLHGVREENYVILKTSKTKKSTGLVTVLLSLPNYTQWQNLIYLTIVVMFLSSTSRIFFPDNEGLSFLYGIYAVCDALYLADVVLLFLHKFMKRLRKIIMVKETRALLLTIDVISLMPQEFVMYFIVGKDSRILFLLRLLVCLRLYRLTSLLVKQNIIYKYNWTLFLIGCCFGNLLIIHGAVCIFFWIGCKDAECELIYGNTWTMISKITYVRPSAFYEWYVLCTYIISNLFFNVGFGDYPATRQRESITYSLVMAVGYYVSTCALIAILTVQIINFNHHRTKFAAKVVNIMQYLRKIPISEPLEKQIEKYYEILWKEKDGMNVAPTASAYLPAALQMELAYDINYGHLQNSLLFKHLPEYFLRRLSLTMKNWFLLPGQEIYNQGVIKSRMIFISNGVLEILSDEDGQSPIISFKKGTILGEASLCLTLPARAILRAATYTELQIIHKIDFMKLMLHHVDILKTIQNRISTRIITAQEEQNEVQKEVIINVLASNVKEFRPIKLLKQKLEDKRRHLKLSTTNDDGLTKIFNENFLNLYKLSDNVSTIEPPRICLTYRYPWILDPNSSLVSSWKTFQLIIQTILIMFLSYYVPFVRSLPHYVEVYTLVADLLYMMEIYFICTSAVITEGRVYKKFGQILDIRMKSWTFYLDVISTFPLEICSYIMKNEKQAERFHTILFLNRLLRYWRIVNFFNKNESGLSSHILVVKLLKHVVFLLTGLFWCGGLLYMQACFYEVCYSKSWYYVKLKQTVNTQDIAEGIVNVVSFSTYFSAMSFLKAGCGDVVPENLQEMITVILISFLGMLMLSYCISDLCAMFSAERRKLTEYKENVLFLIKFLTESNLPRNLRKRIKNYLLLRWHYDGATGRTDFYKTATSRLIDDVQKEEMKEAISKVPLFHMVDLDFRMMVVLNANVVILPKDEVLYYAGDVSREMYIIQSGYCNLLRNDGQLIKTTGPGTELGAVEMVYALPKNHTVTTITNCKVIVIEYEKIRLTLSMFLSVREELFVVLQDPTLLEMVDELEKERHKYTKAHMDKSLLGKKRTSCRRLCSSFLSNSFVFTLRNCMRSKGRDKYWKPFRAMGKMRFVGYFLLPFTIKPDGPFLKAWCLFRAACISLLSIILPFYVVTFPLLYQLHHIYVFDMLISYLDFYLLFHVAYYNEDGILVTHPKFTAKHYLTHSFWVEFLSLCPFALVVDLGLSDYSQSDVILNEIGPYHRRSLYLFHSTIQIIRVSEAINYFESDVMKSSITLDLLKLMAPALTCINWLAAFLFTIDCRYIMSTTKPDVVDNSQIEVTHPINGSVYYGYMDCSDSQWLQSSQFQNTTNPFNIYMTAFYWLSNIMVAIGTGEIEAYNSNITILMVVALIFGAVLFALLVASLAAQRALFSNHLTTYKKYLSDLKFFLRQGNASEDIQWRVVKYFEYIYKRTSGINAQKLCRDLNTALSEDTVLTLYERTLREVPLFENVDKSFMRVIAKHLSEEYYLKGDTIINSSDVQANIYIIHRGKVEVMSSYNEMIACMGPGGLFGNISQISPGLCSVSVIATRILDLLVINSEKFYTVIKDYPRVKHNMENILKTATNYVIPTTIIEDSDNIGGSIRSSELGGSDDQDFDTIHVSLGSRTTNSGSASVYSKDLSILQTSKKTVFYLLLPWKWFRFAIHPDHKIFKIIGWLTIVITFVDILTIPYAFATQDVTLYNTMIIMALESIFYIRILVTLHKAYMSRHGEYISNFRAIFNNYRRYKKRVFWDIVPNIPVGALCLLTPQHILYTLSYIRMYHLLRAYYVVEYFWEMKEDITRTELSMYMTENLIWWMAAIHLGSSLWIFEACPFNICLNETWIDYYNASDQSPISKYSTSFYNIISVITNTGTGDILPFNPTELLIIIIVMVSAKCLAGVIIGDIVTFINLSNLKLFVYETKMRSVRKFLTRQHLSEHQLEKFWTYAKHLWSEENGQSMPTLLQACPYVLLCDIMSEMYGQLLRGSYLFHDINEALLRQLCAKLERIVYFPGNYIVHHGINDQRMYFIYSGKVSVLTIRTNLTETEHAVLEAPEMFGAAQGLFGLNCRFTYRAKTKVVLLSLHRDSWAYIMKYFPKDNKIIFDRAHVLYRDVI